jgi:hypothetical protein
MMTSLDNTSDFSDWWDRGLHHCFPFRIKATGDDFYISGFVFYHRAITGYPAVGEPHPAFLVYKREDRHTDPTLPISPEPDFMPVPFYKGTISDPDGSGGVVSDNTSYGLSHLGPVTDVVSNGRFLYIFTANKSHHTVLWWDADNENWEADWFGIPNPHLEDNAFTLGMYPDHDATGSYPDGTALAGTYRHRFRLVDYVRGRITNFSSFDASSTGVGTNITYEDEIQQVQDATAPSNGMNSRRDSLGRHNDQTAANWTHYQYWTTLSSGSDASPPEVYYFGDEMKNDTNWDGEDGSITGARQVIQNTTLFINGPRVDTATGAADEMTYTDVSLAGSREYSWTEDQYRCRYIEDVTGAEGPDVPAFDTVRAAHRALGLTWAVLEDDNGGLSLVWSDTRFNFPENFPILNEHTLKYTDSTNIRIVSTRDTLYVFGTGGPVYAATRNGQYVNVGEVFEGVTPVNRWAVTAVGTMILVVTANGIKMLDAYSDEPLAVKSLDRLIRDRWASSALRKNISVAYDEDTDCAYVLCPGAAEAACIWFSSDRVSLLSQFPFTWARENEIRDDSGEYRRRAMFISFWGRICYPASLDDFNAEDYTICGPKSTDNLPNETPELLGTVKEIVSTSTHIGLDSTKIHGNKASDGLHDDFRNVLSNGCTIHFHTGDEAGNTYIILPNDNDAGPKSGDMYVAGLPSISVGDYYSLCPIPFGIVGGPLPGTTPRHYDERKHVDTGSYVLSYEKGTSKNEIADIGPMFMGVMTVPGAFATEPPDALDASDPVQLVPDPVGNPLPKWLDETASGVYMDRVPAAGTAISEDSPGNNMWAAGNGFGIAKHVLFPAMCSYTSGWGWDLQEMELSGTIVPADEDVEA